MPLCFVLAACGQAPESMVGDLARAGYGSDTEGFLLAAEEGDMPAMRHFVRLGFRTDDANGQGETPLMRAAAAGQVASVEWLLRRDAAVDRADATGRTALFHAAACGQEAVVRFLRLNGADPDWRDEMGWVPVTVAAYHGQWSSVEALLDAPRRDLEDALAVGVATGKRDVVERLVAAGVNPNGRTTSGHTPLMLAAQRGRTEMLELLLRVGAEPLARDQEGNTAADLANRAGHADVARMLAPDTVGAANSFLREGTDGPSGTGAAG